mgnify:CR=1 FL=1
MTEDIEFETYRLIKNFSFIRNVREKFNITPISPVQENLTKVKKASFIYSNKDCNYTPRI